MSIEGQDTDQNARTWATLAHVAGMACYTGIPFAGIIAVLVIWLIKREEHPFIEDQGRESLNFQISVGIYSLVAAVLMLVLVGFLLLLALFFFHLICTILAIIAASKGQSYRYPLTIRLINRT